MRQVRPEVVALQGAQAGHAQRPLSQFGKFRKWLFPFARKTSIAVAWWKRLRRKTSTTRSRPMKLVLAAFVSTMPHVISAKFPSVTPATFTNSQGSSTMH
jgi:hypothetical protein